MTQAVWFITGATSGFGMRFVHFVLARGDRVIATGRSLEKLRDLVSSLKSEDLERVRTAQLDITAGEERIKAIVDEVVTPWGHIDVLLNNAGFGLLGLIEEGGSKLLRRQFDTNVFGVVDVTAAVLPYLRKSNAGRVIVIGSRSAWRANTPGLGVYAASKAAVHAITEGLMTELAPFNIKVMLVQPGAFRTEGMYGQPYFTENPIPEYDDLRSVNMKRYASIAGTEPGNPDKAVEAMVDVIKGEGVAQDRPWPSYLFLGEDAEADVRSKCTVVLNALDEWAYVTRAVSFENNRGAVLHI